MEIERINRGIDEPRLSLLEVGEGERTLLWNIRQKFLYEMTRYYPDDMDENGEYHYGNFDAYFDDDARKAYLIRNQNALVGFAMIHSDSYLGEKPDHVLAEFSIFPSYRRRHYAALAAGMILNRFQGKWEIKFNENNAGAKGLWESLTRVYDPVVHHLNAEETVLAFSNRTTDGKGEDDHNHN